MLSQNIMEIFAFLRLKISQNRKGETYWIPFVNISNIKYKITEEKITIFEYLTLGCCDDDSPTENLVQAFWLFKSDCGDFSIKIFMLISISIYFKTK